MSQPKTRTLRIDTPRVFLPLLKPARYKGAHGGRGSGKSHHFGGALIEDCLLGHTRAACLREVQNSIKDSVKQLLEDKIRQYEVEHLFRVTDIEITGPHDSLIVFRGLQNHTAGSIKSLEKFNRAWIEEAQTISQRSLDIATPTFRNNAEMWFSWNPKSAKDPVDRLFRENAGDPDFICVEANYRDNPWFPDDIRRDMERDRSRDPDKYAHVWLGGYERHSEARVFRNWTVREFETPPQSRFYFGADWGFSVDPTVLIRCFIDGRTLYVDREAYEVGCEIDYTPALFAGTDARINRRWENPKLHPGIDGSLKWPIVADSARPETISYMQKRGFSMKPSIKGKGSVEDGIEFLKSYDIVVHPGCKHTIDELSFYSYKTDKLTEEVLPVLDDKKNHVIDALRYAVESTRRSQPLQVSDAALRRSAMR